MCAYIHIPGLILPNLNRPVALDSLHIGILKEPMLVQPKLDGWRVVGSLWNGTPGLLSRTGKQVSCSQFLLDALKLLPDNTVVDGEYIRTTDTLHVFDILVYAGTPMYQLPLERRSAFVKLHISDRFKPKLVPVTDQLYLPSNGYSSFKALVQPVFGEEGRVLKPLQGNYSSPWYKYKFYKSLTGILVASAGESGKVALWKDDTCQELIEICGLKIPVGMAVGTLVEVRYLEATVKNRLTQPILICTREDVKLQDCTLDRQIVRSYEILTDTLV